MDKLRTCFFTGHRRLAADRQDEIKEKLAENIEKLITDYDVKNFISGGAIGFDMLAAEAVIAMRQKYPHIRLLIYIPCYKQSAKWSYNIKYRYNMILSQADEKLFVTEDVYSEGCMRKRNLKMIEDSFFCIAYCIKYASGTGATMKIAREEGLRIINIAQ